MHYTTDAAINRSPFFMAHATSNGSRTLLLDRFEIGCSDMEAPNDVYSRIVGSLTLPPDATIIDAETMISLLSEQFEAASEFVYSHPFWEAVRMGNSRPLIAYIIETRHYLAAAALRMSPAISPGIGLNSATRLQSQHLIEEWDHQDFFEAALRELGCDQNLIRQSRPLPTTIEWIHLTRFIGSKRCLSAVACSGFMEYSSKELGAVRAWHELLHARKLIPKSAGAAIFSHVETDLDYGHSENWKNSIRAEVTIPAKDAADILNDVCCVAEMIYRWLGSLNTGIGADIVTAIQVLSEDGVSAPTTDSLEVKVFDGFPVWPSGMISLVSENAESGTQASNIVVGCAYALGHLPECASNSQLMKEARGFMARLSHGAAESDTSTWEAIHGMASSWLVTIEGHPLWDALLEPGCDALVAGYILENFHYLASAARHIAPAISSCTTPVIRRAYIAHFVDELEHCDILGEKLSQIEIVPNLQRARPLPTTMAFVGYLQALARSDWRAYVVVSTFLQVSLAGTRRDGRNRSFYERVGAANPDLRDLIQSMAIHDEIDEGLGHDDLHLDRLAALLSTESISRSSIALAAVTPQLAWSFLDGILQHYSCGNAAILQRTGWGCR